MRNLIRLAAFLAVAAAVLWSAGIIPHSFGFGSTDTTLVASYAETDPQRDESKITVYVTRTGERYHRASCQHLRRSSIPMSLSEAKRAGYTPCKVCRPPR
jgi:hypothetical protein